MGKCIDENCNTCASFNYPGETKKLYCVKHKKDTMINLKNKVCVFEGCKTQCYFNYPTEKSGLYCSAHKLPNMIDVKHRRCLAEGCTTQASFNKLNTKSALYCSVHKLSEMVDIHNKKCLATDCGLTPYFNYPDIKKGIYCSKHKLEGMVDIKHKKCIHEGCKLSASFNEINETAPLYCSKHKTQSMIMTNFKFCAFEGCYKIPYFNNEGEKRGKYCATHKEPNMINVLDDMCKTPLCMVTANKKYEGYCFSCFMQMFPDKPNTRNYKTKEKYTTDYIKEKIPNVDWIVDRKVYGGCSRRRPDLYLDLGYQVLVVEIDENQHTNYDCSCENKRLMEISQDIDHRPLIFIRFNPDDYVSGENKITSCWGLDGNGICAIKKTKIKEWNTRLETLKQQVKYWIDPKNKTDKTIEVVQLYYDQ